MLTAKPLSPWPVAVPDLVSVCGRTLLSPNWCNDGRAVPRVFVEQPGSSHS